MKQRGDWIEEHVERAMDPLREHLDGLKQQGQEDEAWDQAIGLIGRLTARLAAIEYEDKVSRHQRKSEQIDPKQLALALDELEKKGLLQDDEDLDDEVADEEIERLIEQGEQERKDDEQAQTPPKKKRRELPPRLPRVQREQDVEPDELRCPRCGEERAEIGRDVVEKLDLAPIRFQVLRIERIRRACQCKETGVVVAPPAADQFERVLASTGLLAWLVAAKYDAHLPLYRLQKLCRQMGCAITDTTLGGWVARSAFELRPLVDAMWKEAKQSWLVQTDATGQRVLDRDAPGGSRLGQMWCYLADGGRICVFRYAPDGEGKHGPWKHLAGREGYIQADAAGVFDRLFNGEVASAIEVGCIAHARRKFADLLDTDKRVARPLKHIQDLYRIEKAAKVQGMGPADRLHLRRRKSLAVMQRLERWLLKTAGREPPKSALARACAYWINHWVALTRFLHDGRVEIDNTDVEREMRSIALGRKNSLFVGSDHGGDNAAVLYSLTRTCTLNDVDPVAYLTDVLGKIASGWPEARITELLPHRWVQQHHDPQTEPPA
jgi:transposase